MKTVKRAITFIGLALIASFFVYTNLGSILDKVLKQPAGKTHTEIMLWSSPGYPKKPELNFFKMEIHPSSDKVQVIYKIENASDKETDVRGDINLELVDGDANKIADPGTTVWRWSQTGVNREMTAMSLAPGKCFTEEIIIDRKQAHVSSQYYINALYQGELVSQYKIIEGLYDK